MKFDIKKSLTQSFETATAMAANIVGEAPVNFANAKDFIQAKSEEFKAKSAETVKAIRTFWSH